MHKTLIRLIKETGREVLDYKDVKLTTEDGTTIDGWAALIKHGSYIVHLIHPLNQKFIEMRFAFDLNEEYKKTLKDKLVDANRVNKFNYGLRCAIMIPQTSFTFALMDGPDGTKIAVGFNIIAKAFPFDRSFNIQLLEESIQSLISLGTQGTSFFGSVLNVSETSIKHAEPASIPNTNMYA